MQIPWFLLRTKTANKTLAGSFKCVNDSMWLFLLAFISGNFSSGNLDLNQEGAQLSTSDIFLQGLYIHFLIFSLSETYHFLEM